MASENITAPNGVAEEEEILNYEYKDGVVYLKSKIPCEALDEFLGDTEAMDDYPFWVPGIIHNPPLNEKTETPVLCSGPTKSWADKNNLLLVIETKDPEKIDEVIGKLERVTEGYVKQCERIDDEDFEDDKFGMECQTYLCWARCKNRQNREDCIESCDYLVENL